MKNYNKTFIIPSKGSQIFVKLYLLNIEQMNMIFSYINRIEFKPYLNNIVYNNKYNCYEIIKDEIKVNLAYSAINCLGTYMNIDIFAFSTLNYLQKYKNQNKNKILCIKDNKVEEEEIGTDDNSNSLPSTKKIAKLIKILMINFPDYSKDYLINYLINSFSSKNESNQSKLSEKILEVNNLLMSKRKSLYEHKDSIKINKTNQILKNIISSIPTNSMSSIETNNNQNDANLSCSEFISDSKCILNGNSQNNKINSQHNFNNNNIFLSFSSIQKNDFFLNNQNNSVNKFMVTSKEKEPKKNDKSIDTNNNEKLIENKLYRNIRKSNGLTLKTEKMQKSALPSKNKHKLKININNCSYVKKEIKNKDKNLEIYINDFKKGDDNTIIIGDKKIKWKKNKTKNYFSPKNGKLTRNSCITYNTNNTFQDLNKDDINITKKYETINTEANRGKLYHIYHNKIPKINKTKKNGAGKKRNKEISDKINLISIEKDIAKTQNIKENNYNRPLEIPKKYEKLNIDAIRASLNCSIQKTGSTKNSITSLNKKIRYETPTRIKNFRYYN
jgi:hypothetical protein